MERIGSVRPDVAGKALSFATPSRRATPLVAALAAGCSISFSFAASAQTQVRASGSVTVGAAAGAVAPVPPPPPNTNTNAGAPPTWQAVNTNASQPAASAQAGTAPAQSAQAILQIPSVGSPLPIYTQQLDGRWGLTCHTPCSLRVAVGNVTIATLPDGRDAITIPVPAEGRTYQPEFAQRPSVPSATTTPNPSGMSSADSLASIGVTPGAGGYTGQGPSPGAIVFVTGTVIGGLGIIGAMVSFLGLSGGFGSFGYGYWFAGFGASIGVFALGGTLATVGWYMGVSFHGTGSGRIGFAPILTPQMQGAGVTVRF